MPTLKHIKRKHSAEDDKIFMEQDEVLSEEGMVENDDQPTTELSTNKTKQNRINVAIVKNLIIKCNLSVYLVENNSFRDFMKECNIKWNPVSAKKSKI